MELEPFHLLHARLGISGGSQSFGDIWAPSYNLLVLVVIKDCGNLGEVSSLSRDRTASLLLGC